MPLYVSMCAKAGRCSRTSETPVWDQRASGTGREENMVISSLGGECIMYAAPPQINSQLVVGRGLQRTPNEGAGKGEGKEVNDGQGLAIGSHIRH